MLKKALALCLPLLIAACQSPTGEPASSTPDVQEESGVEVVILEYASAEDVALVLNELVVDASRPAEPTTQIIADPSGNRLLIEAPEETLAQLKDLIVQLDIPVPPE